MLRALPFMLLAAASLPAAEPPTYRFPKDPHVLDAKADLGAQGRRHKPTTRRRCRRAST